VVNQREIRGPRRGGSRWDVVGKGRERGSGAGERRGAKGGMNVTGKRAEAGCDRVRLTGHSPNRLAASYIYLELLGRSKILIK